MSEPYPAAHATIDVDRPVDVVRAHFFDVDHAIRSNIHHGVALRWLPSEAAGERRIEEETKALSRVQVGVFVIEEGEDGAWVKRFVAGANAGARIVVSFSPAGVTVGDPRTVPHPPPARTTVKMVAFAGAGGYHTGIGKLSPVGLEKLLQKTLEEHRRALEGYVPGRARGAVGAVLLPMRDAVVQARAKTGHDGGHPQAPGGEARAVMTNLLEAACLVAVADGVADDAERDAIQEVARTLCFIELDAAAVDRMVHNVAAAVSTEGIGGRCDKLAQRLSALGLGEVGLGVAALVAEVSHGIGVEEHCALSRLADALGLGEAALADRILRTDRVLGGRT